MELALQQLETFIAGMAAGDREAAVSALRGLLSALDKYAMPLSPRAMVGVLRSLLMAYAGGDRAMAKLKAKVAEKAQQTGPHVAAIFSAR